MSTPVSAENSRDGHALLQLLLDTPQLAQYYHFDERPERVPLKIVNATTVDLGPANLTAAGTPVALSRGHDDQAFELTACELQGDKAEMKFRYPVEGLIGHATFKKVKDRWSLDRVEVAEGK